MDNYKFGNLLCSLRESHNLTQRQLAQMLDVSDKAVFVSADYSTVYYYNDEFVRTDDLPYDAVPRQ